ncbi:Methyltransferase domain-containing protein [Halogranum gelatinilyticum]|uniref:Methyltransferase domain-containing protein n=1 Tax=Halogranum gelatinilyticum TaxID=660521 RepID=A0A1G9P6C7_9EURY|nr:class I SAM-dependent methyltransferase [Halogranum gelatinilyticum]SDL94051.1 Methyltransferase domain-containing protein [Halogranum gelatinilyticum]
MTRFQNTRQPDWDWWGELWDDPETTLRTLGADDADSVLDLACGDGFFTVPLAELVDGPVYGVDLDPDYLARLRDYAAESDADVTPIAGDARDLPSLLTEPVDYVLLANTFHGVDDQEGLANAVYDVLEPGGRFAIVNWHDRPREETTVTGTVRGPPTDLRMTPDETREVVEAGGFATVETVELPPYHYGVIFER